MNNTVIDYLRNAVAETGAELDAARAAKDADGIQRYGPSLEAALAALAAAEASPSWRTLARDLAQAVQSADPKALAEIRGALSGLLQAATARQTLLRSLKEPS